jgi:hypothetical protein
MDTGQINASLTSFSRTIEDYNKLAKQELVPEKQTKAYERIKNFRTEQADYKERFERLRKEIDERVCGFSLAKILSGIMLIYQCSNSHKLHQTFQCEDLT